MKLPENHSHYLIKPDLSRRRHRRWVNFRTRWRGFLRFHQPIATRLGGTIVIWIILASLTVRVFSDSDQNATPTHSDSAKAANITTTGLVKPLVLTSAKPAQMLPGGPTGQLLPPGTIAPDRTYPNRYTKGQCTWYVAGRRQIPDNWGNAAAWYYHAVASHWSVGTTPAIAAIAWTPVGRYGHVALVEQISADAQRVYISEMNYRGPGIKSTRWVAASAFKYIY